MSSFTLHYYEGEEREVNCEQEEFASIQKAGEWCDGHNVPVSCVCVTEYDEDEIIGQCCLEEPYELKYESLDF